LYTELWFEADCRDKPALIVKGRMYDVTTRHLLEPVEDFIETAAKQVIQIHCSKDAEGDILVFMPGESIRLEYS
jgi:HrpA-like RNA helicase